LLPRKPRVDSLREYWRRFEKTLASELAVSFAKRPPAWPTKRNSEIFLTPIADILRRMHKKGGSAKRMSDVFSEFRASLIGKEFENATLAWLAQALQRMHSVSSVHNLTRSIPLVSPFRAAIGQSPERLPSRLGVVKSLCDARAPAPSPRDTPPKSPPLRDPN
jgi:hypothetical protein